MNTGQEDRQSAPRGLPVGPEHPCCEHCVPGCEWTIYGGHYHRCTICQPIIIPTQEGK